MGATPALQHLPGRVRTRGVCLRHPTLWNGVTSRQQTLALPPLSPAPLGRLFARLKSVGLAAGIGENVPAGTSLWLVRHGINGGSRGRALQARVGVAGGLWCLLWTSATSELVALASCGYTSSQYICSLLGKSNRIVCFRSQFSSRGFSLPPPASGLRSLAPRTKSSEDQKDVEWQN